MYKQPSKEIMDFKEKYSIDSDEIFNLPTTDAWIIKHKALERVAAEQNITFEQPQIATRIFETEGVAMLVIGRLGDRSEWSFGEASPLNLTRKSDKKPLYPWAMAEKRAKDRVILKLLNAHGALYSEEESDDFRDPSSGERTTLPKKDARGIFDKMQEEVRSSPSREALKEWMKGNASRIQTLPQDWQDILRLQCEEMLADLRNKEAA